MRIVALLFLACPGLLFADAASKKAKIEEYFELTQIQRTMEQTMAQVMESMRVGFLQQLEDVKLTAADQQVFENFQFRVGKIIGDALAWPKIKGEYTALFDQTFTEAEIDGMNAFYKSPAGKAMVAKLPVLMRKGSELGQQRMQLVMPELQKAINELIDEAKARKVAPKP